MKTQGPTRSALRRGGGNSLAAHMASAIDGLLQGKDLATHGPVFSSQDHVTPAYVRNPNFWGPAPLGVSPWNSDNAAVNAGTAITPQHVIYTNHGLVGVGFPANGSTLRFITATNVVVSRTQLQHFRIPNTDVVIARLDSDLPATIPPFPVAPDNLNLYIPNGIPVPVMVLDQEEKGLVMDMYNHSSRDAPSIWFRKPVNPTRLSFWELPIAGDSGDPVTGLISGAWTVMGLVTNAEGQSPGMAGLNAALASAITSVDALGGGLPSGHAVTNPVLTGFSRL